MLTDAKRRALRAAQQVSFVAIAACSGQIEIVSPLRAAGDASASNDAATIDAPGKVDAPVADGRVDAPDTQADVGPPATCADIKAVAGTKGAVLPPMSDADTRACCLDFINALPQDGAMYNTPCCDFLWDDRSGVQVPNACIPWGPPMPPSMV